jgi:tRNA splicing ligase
MTEELMENESKKNDEFYNAFKEMLEYISSYSKILVENEKKIRIIENKLYEHKDQSGIELFQEIFMLTGEINHSTSSILVSSKNIETLFHCITKDSLKKYKSPRIKIGDFYV